MSNPPLIAIVGPTASGKSALAMDLAAQMGAEIVNADAFCLYRGMDIGTAKPTAEDRARVRHHVLDTHDVGDEVDVAGYQVQARAAIEDVLSRGVPVLLVGGSGLYVSAVVDDLRFPGTDAAVRARWEAALADIGPARLHEHLARVDPAAAAAILPGNGRRIVRALEVNEITGAPFQATLAAPAPWRTGVRVGWDPGVHAVDDAIAGRVTDMWAGGFVDEVRALAPFMGRTASRAVGYREILHALDTGDDPDTAIGPTILATRRLARRQRRWFRRDPSIHWAQSSSQVAQILGRVEV